LIIGINDYHALRPLKGAVADAVAITQILNTHASGARNFDCKPLLSTSDAVITEQLLRETIEEVFTKAVDVVSSIFPVTEDKIN
jgi:hypothetical protein